MRVRSTARRSILFALAAIVTLASCSSLGLGGGPDGEDLDRSLSAIRKQIMFGRYANAKALVVPTKQSAFTRYVFTVEDRIKVAEFDAQAIDIVDLPEEEAFNPDDPREARVLVRMAYTMRPNMELQKALVEMVWVPIAGGWMLDFPEDGWDL